MTRSASTRWRATWCVGDCSSLRLSRLSLRPPAALQPAGHQAADRYFVLPGAAAPGRAARARPEHEEKRAHPQGQEGHRGRQEEGCPLICVTRNNLDATNKSLKRRDARVSACGWRLPSSDVQRAAGCRDFKEQSTINQMRPSLTAGPPDAAPAATSTAPSRAAESRHARSGRAQAGDEKIF